MWLLLLLRCLMLLPVVISFHRHSCYLRALFRYFIVAFQFIPERPSLRGFSCNIVLALSLTTFTLTLCRNGTPGQTSSGSGQLLPETTTALGPSLQPSHVLISSIQASISS
jgi:hypothetical protein